MAFGLVQHARFAFEGDDDGDTTRKGGIVHYHGLSNNEG
jgi:hypothetical protein